jgi:two-component system, LytTR family, response regulator
MLTAMIVDDEPLARVHLRRLLEAQGVQVVGEADSAPMALQMAEDTRVDVLMLDIQMPGFSGMQLASALLHLDSAPLIIFVTAYAEHAVAAFEHDALDYLLKPVAPDRLAKTLLRARERLADQQARRQIEQQVAQHATTSPPLRRLLVRGDYAVQLLRVEEILSAEARDRRIFVRTQKGDHRTYYTLSELETLLPAERFLRIHESYLVNLDAIEEILFLGNHTYAVRLAGDRQAPVSRKRYAELQRRLGVTVTARP